MANIYEKLMNVQQELKAPKNQYNSIGEYKYRSCEDILEAVKPLLKKNKLTLQINDTIVPASETRFYIKATAKLIDVESEAAIENTAFAREVDDKKKLDGSQLTGVSSSYARKYALNGLFLIDDTKDADTDEFQKQTSEEKFVTKAQIKKLGELVEDIPAMLNYYKVDKIENLRYEDAKKTIERKENATKREDS